MQGGILFDLLESYSFKTAIQKLLHGLELRNELGNAGSKLVAARNAKSRFAAAFASVYEAILHSRQSRLVQQSVLVP